MSTNQYVHLTRFFHTRTVIFALQIFMLIVDLLQPLHISVLLCKFRR